MSPVPWNDPDGETQHDATARNEVDLRTPVPALSLAYHPDVGRVGERKLLGSEGLDLCRSAPYFQHPRGGAHHSLELQRISRKAFRITPRPDGSVSVERTGSSSSLEVDGVLVDEKLEISAAQVERGAVLVLAHICVLLLHRMEPLPPPARSHGLIGQSSALDGVRRAVDRFADTAKPVLIRGENGTGKELVAQALHRCSPRSRRRLVPVNMGAVGRDVAAAELFGSVSGAFTGAKDRAGVFQEADGSTLFLDEIGTATPSLQALLLRALENGEIQKVGAGRPHKVDVRVLSATDADLEAMVEAGTFSQALLGRLGLLTIDVPPLRRRREDIGPLFFHFLKRELEEHGEAFRLDPERNGRPWVGVELMKRLLVNPWASNVRGLKSIAEQIALHNRGEDRVRHLPEALRTAPAEAASSSAEHPKQAPKTRTSPTALPRRDPSSLDRATLEQALRRNGWEIKATAEELNVSRSSLHGLVKRHGLPIAGELTREQILAAEAEFGLDLAAMADALQVGVKGLKDRRRRLGLSLTCAELEQAWQTSLIDDPELDGERRMQALTRRLKLVDAEHLRLRLQDCSLDVARS